MTTIYIVRHGQSGHNVLLDPNLPTDKSWGEFESPLTQHGEEQARKRAEDLRHIHFDAVFSSDLTRARRTAEIIALERKIEVQTTHLIRERHFYDYLYKLEKLGKSGEEFRDEVRTALHTLDEKGKMAYKHGEGMESAEEAATRLLTFLREIAVAYDNKTVLIVNHDTSMRSLLTRLGYAKFDELPENAIENTGYMILESDGVDFFIKKVVGIHKQQGTTRDI